MEQYSNNAFLISREDTIELFLTIKLAPKKLQLALPLEMINPE